MSNDRKWIIKAKGELHACVDHKKGAPGAVTAAGRRLIAGLRVAKWGRPLLLQLPSPTPRAASPLVGANLELADLVGRSCATLEGFPITFVEDRWLRIIAVDQVAGQVGVAIPQGERDVLAARLEKALSDTEPFEIVIGSLLSYGTEVIADVHPHEPLNDLHTTVRAAIQTVRGPNATGYPTKVPHLTLGYAAEECDCDPGAEEAAQRSTPGTRPDAGGRRSPRGRHRGRTGQDDHVGPRRDDPSRCGRLRSPLSPPGVSEPAGRRRRPRMPPSPRRWPAATARLPHGGCPACAPGSLPEPERPA